MIKDFIQSNRVNKGTVYLVGAGPGDIGLLTIRALYLLQNVDVIAYDGLVNRALLDLFPSIEKIYVGKKKNNLFQQEDINNLLVRLANENKMVVRLKGGDPIVFGRGGEESLYLKKHGIPFEIVPSITSGQAVPSYAGIPITDRDLASHVAFVTAQENPGKKNSAINWNRLAQLDGSLVVYMGVKAMPSIVKYLCDAGKAGETLVSVIEGATLPRQRVIDGTLETIVERLRTEKVESPSIIVVGDVNRLKEEIAWFDPKKAEGDYVGNLEIIYEFARNTVEEDQVSNVSEIKHGGDIHAFAERVGIDESDVHDFSSNINPIGLPNLVQKTYQDSMSEILKYPDSKAKQLAHEIADYHQIHPRNVLAGNGSIALIDLVIRSLKPNRALLVEPCFNEYRRLLQLSNVEVTSILLTEEDDFQLPFDEILKEFKNANLLMLGHPNNPTGNALSVEKLLYLIEYAKEQKKIVLADEAFIDWHSDDSVLSYVKDNSSVVVVRSLTKFYSLAGIRAGYACAHEDIIQKMMIFQETWGCNGLAQKLSIAALRDEKFRSQSLQWFEKEHSYMFESLDKVPFIKVYPSRANYFFCKILRESLVNVFWDTMEQSGIYLRGNDGFAGLNDHFFRIALKTHKENVMFLEVLNKFRENQVVYYD